jgi:hypothetical protein
MVIPFSAFKNELSVKFGWHLILLWPFSETDAAAIRARSRHAPARATAGFSLIETREITPLLGASGRGAVRPQVVAFSATKFAYV